MQREAAKFGGHSQQFWILNGEKYYKAAFVVISCPIRNRAAERTFSVIRNQQVVLRHYPTAAATAFNSPTQAAGALIPLGGVRAFV